MPALVAVQLHLDAEAAEVGHRGVCQWPCLLIGDDVNWSLRELVHGDQEVSFSPVVRRERPSSVNCDPPELRSDVVFVH